MVKEIYVYDTTLRDGSQSEGVSYSLEDKVRIAKKLDSFGISFIEGGWPYSNPKDKEFFDYFKKNPLKKSQLVSFGSTRYVHSKAEKDKNLISLVNSGTSYITIFGKTWDLHVRDVLKTSLDENLKMVFDSVSFLKKKKRKVFYDAEHFFDGFKANKEYALKTLKAAAEGGADSIVLCDTNGGSLSWEISSIIEQVKEVITLPLGIHTHNDCGFALANSLVAVSSGCNQVQGTINGYGERCGNADLIPIMAILQAKMGYKMFGVKKLDKLAELSHYISEISNMKHQDNLPFVGRSAFAHKAGVHINAVLKNPLAYEHMNPELVGNKRRILTSEVSGKTAIVMAAKDLDFELDKKSSQVKKIHKMIQLLEKEGYQFEAADGSLKLIIQRNVKRHKKFFSLLGFRVIVEKTETGKIVTEATLKLKIDNKVKYTVAEGDGPVNALDAALRRSLSENYPCISQMHLTDFKVRVLDERKGTATKVRVLIESQDAEETWSTIGVSENIIEASWQALVDSLEYKLLKESKRNTIK